MSLITFISDNNGKHSLHVDVDRKKNYNGTHEMFREFPDMLKFNDANSNLFQFVLTSIEKKKYTKIK